MTRSTQAPDLATLLASIAPELEQVNAWLDQQYQPDHALLAPLIEHVRGFRGKQIRAAQVLLVARACGQLSREHTVVAGVVEMIHAATLVHDDLLDGAAERRGLDCVHRRWDAHSSVLLGDWIYARAFQRATELSDRRCSRELAEATGRVCQGEIRQNLSAGNFNLDEAEYLDQIDGKTAALFASGGRLAALFAGADEDLAGRCAEHGLLAGRAFQMQDDLLDLVGDERRARKSLGTDWANGKMTLPLIRLRDRLDPAGQAALQAAFGQGGSREQLFAPPFAAAMDEALAHSRQEIDDTLEAACQALAGLPVAEARDQLVALTRFLGSRTR